jgi:hypothetical protein
LYFRLGTNSLSMDQTAIIQWCAARKLSIEILLTMLVITSAALNYFAVSGGQEAVMITMSVLSGFYFISAYFQPDLQGLLGIIATKVIAIASSVCIIGLLFAMLHLVGAAEMLMIGVSSLTGALLIVLYQALTAWSPSFMPIIIRAAILILISGTSYLKLIQSAAN